MSNIETQWAWSQVEAAADGTLAPAERERMRVAMRADAKLREAVKRAANLRGGLRRLRNEPVPPSLLRRLLRIPGLARPASARRPRSVTVSAGLALAAAAAIAVVALREPLRRSPPAPSPVMTRGAQKQAVADFGVAMAYLRQSVAIAGDESAAAVRGALATDHGAADSRPHPSERD